MAADVTAVLDRSRIARAPRARRQPWAGWWPRKLAIRFPQRRGSPGPRLHDPRLGRMAIPCRRASRPADDRGGPGLPVEVAQRSLVENALAPDTLKEHPETGRAYRPQTRKPGPAMRLFVGSTLPTPAPPISGGDAAVTPSAALTPDYVR